MKCQMTCNNCGTRFVTETEKGQTIECNCPHCHGSMEITLSLAGTGRQYERPTGFVLQTQQVQGETHKKDSNAILRGVAIGLLLLASSVDAYFTFGSSSPETPVTGSIPNDTISYESPIEVEQTPPVDTVVTVPAVLEQKEEEQVEEQPEEDVDTITMPEHDE